MPLAYLLSALREADWRASFLLFLHLCFLIFTTRFRLTLVAHKPRSNNPPVSSASSSYPWPCSSDCGNSVGWPSPGAIAEAKGLKRSDAAFLAPAQNETEAFHGWGHQVFEIAKQRMRTYNSSIAWGDQAWLHVKHECGNPSEHRTSSSTASHHVRGGSLLLSHTSSTSHSGSVLSRESTFDFDFNFQFKSSGQM